MLHCASLLLSTLTFRYLKAPSKERRGLLLGLIGYQLSVIPDVPIAIFFCHDFRIVGWFAIDYGNCHHLYTFCMMQCYTGLDISFHNVALLFEDDFFVVPDVNTLRSLVYYLACQSLFRVCNFWHYDSRLCFLLNSCFRRYFYILCLSSDRIHINTHETSF